MASPSPHPTREEGLRLLRAVDLDACIECLNAVLEADPTDARAWSYLGAAQAQKGNLDQAIAAFQQSLALGPTHRAYFNLGRAYELAGRPADALSHFQSALQLNPNYALAADAINRISEPPEGQADHDAAQPEQAPTETGQTADTEDTDAPAATAPAEQSTQDAPAPATNGKAVLSDSAVPAEAGIAAEHKAMMKSGLIWGAIVGIVWTVAIFLVWSFLLPSAPAAFSASKGGLGAAVLILVCIGAAAGAVIGLSCGFTGGGEETGVKVGAALGLTGGAVVAIIGGSGGAGVALGLLAGALLGGAGGYVIGFLTDAGLGLSRTS